LGDVLVPRTLAYLSGNSPASDWRLRTSRVRKIINCLESEAVIRKTALRTSPLSSLIGVSITLGAETPLTVVTARMKASVRALRDAPFGRKRVALPPLWPKPTEPDPEDPVALAEPEPRLVAKRNFQLMA
jgi:hypothetical protein